MDRRQLEEWLAAYGEAWERKDTGAFVGLFSPDARYHWTPFEAAKRGREALAEAFDAAVARQRGISFGSEVLSVAEGVGIAHWRCSFDRVETGDRVRLDGIFRMEFDEDGLCRSFREWWHSDEKVGRAADDSGQVADGEVPRVVRDFVAAINAHDVERLAESMTPDHVFVDSLGREVRGREAMRVAWGRYFELFPDYEVRVDETLSRGASVGLFGVARGTCAGEGAIGGENGWTTPAAWKAVVRDGRVAEWRVFADNEPVRRILAGRRE